MSDHDLGIYFLDVGQGDCTFIVPPKGEGNPILFDCADDFVATRFCEDHKVDELEAVVASHLDSDHVRGILPFLRSHFDAGRRVSKLAIGIDRRIEGSSETLQTLISAALDWDKSPPHTGFGLVRVDRDKDGPIVIASGATWEVELVLPFHGDALKAAVTKGDANLASVVLRVTRGATSVLIGADAPLSSWERLEASKRRATVIRTPHHGGELNPSGSTFRAFGDLYGAVGADLGVVSVGTNNQHSHPKLDHIRAARRGGACQLACTQMTGACDKNAWALRPRGIGVAKSVGWPWRHEDKVGSPKRPTREVPCAGTVVVSLAPDGAYVVLPNEASHRDMVDAASDPMCERN